MLRTGNYIDLPIRSGNDISFALFSFAHSEMVYLNRGDIEKATQSFPSDIWSHQQTVIYLILAGLISQAVELLKESGDLLNVN